MASDVFPPDFLWGAATAAHQVEGGNDNSDWWDWEAEPGRIHDGSRSGDAAGWWLGRAEEDLARAAEMGHNAHRLSVEWSRLEPEPGMWDEQAFRRYEEILAAARARGLRTLVTLYHFTLPRWVARAGSWLWDDLPDRFERFCERVAARLGPGVDLWATINEPNVLAVMSYGGTAWPPGAGSMRKCFEALANLTRAHAQGYHAIHRVAPGAEVGLVLNMPLFEPARPGHPLDRAAAWMQDWGMSGVLLEGLRSGRLLPPLALVPRRVEGLQGSADFLGLNYYGRLAVRFDPRAETPLGRHVQEPSTRTEFTDWGQACARGLTAQLVHLSRYRVPLYVTENGLYDNDDVRRPSFLIEHVQAVAEAIRRGADVRGYFHWSLVDNFEWAEGWATHFGLLALNRRTGARTPRRSAEVYAAICRANGVPADLTP
ncbi:glycoside hydrolase family 1 protein [Haliangium sp.]|uniref:glycoside hydrolase family 1 protein n=1 Tax=Haliangium sp. TaxID=2663208 RepID=UPI003D1364F9